MISLRPEQLDVSLGFLRPVHAGAREKMKASLLKYGQLTAVIAVEDEGRNMLIDGFKRHRCARDLGMDRLKVTLLKKSSAEAKALLYLLNRAQGFSMIMEALLVRDLVEVEGLNQVEAAVMLERHKSWVSRRLFMIRHLAPEIISDITLQLLPDGVGPSLARLSFENQIEFSLAIQRHGLKSREIHRLVDLFCKIKDPGARRHLLASPREALEVVKQDKEKWLWLIETILMKMSALNRHLGNGKISGKTGRTLMEFSDQVKVHMEKIDVLAKNGGAHEPVN